MALNNVISGSTIGFINDRLTLVQQVQEVLDAGYVIRSEPMAHGFQVRFTSPADSYVYGIGETFADAFAMAYAALP